MLLLLLALALVGASVAQDTTNTTKTATHIITTSDRFRAGYPMVLLAEIIKGTKPVAITVAITYKKYEVNSTENEVFKSSPVSVLPGEANKLEFQIPEGIPTPENRWDGNYQIKVNGVGDEVSFSYSSSISRDDKTSAVLITSDKAIYKPGETVKFRILALDPDSLRVKNVAMNYTFTDPNGNKMKIVKNAVGAATQGVVQDEFKLTDNTIRGDWKLTVEIRDQEEEYTFTVDEYVLPRFEVTVDLPPYCVVSDLSVPITVTGKYTYGQPVADADVIVTIRQYQTWMGAKSQGIIRTGKLSEDGAFSININSKEILKMITSDSEYVTSLNWQQIEVVANVTEELTGRKQSGTAVTQFYQSRLKAEFLANTANNYKEGMASTLYIELKQRDDTALSTQELAAIQATFNVTYDVPLTDEEWQKQINESNAQSNAESSSNSSDAINSKIIRGGIGYWRPSKTYILELKNPVQTPTENGFLSFTFTPPVGATSISIQVMFNKPYQEDTLYKYMSKSYSPSNNFMSIVAQTEMPQVGKNLNLRIATTEPITRLIYQIISKGVIVDSGVAVSSTPRDSTSIELSVKITQRMSPSITIAVYYIRPQNSEVVVDALSLPVNGLFQSSVSMSFSPDRAEPGDPVELIIDAAESALVFTVANDKSVELLKSGNQLTQEKVQETIATFAYGTFFPWFGAMFRCGFPYYNSGSDAASVFRGANILAFSDGDVYRKQYDDIGIQDKNILAESAAGKAAFGAAAAIKVRKNFPENWIWDVYTIKSTDGRYRETLTAPDTITKWNAYAFSVHPNLGLSVIKAPAELTTFRTMFAEVTLPYSLVRGEQYCMLIRVFNYYTEPLSVLVTFENHASFKNVFVQREGNSITTTEENMSTAELLQNIEPNGIGSFTVCITAVELGFIPIKVTAESDVKGLSDALEQQILIKPEGVEESVNYPSLPDLTTEPTWTRNIALDFPADTVPGSEQVTVSVTGNFLGPIYANIQDLVGKSYGCGEQNMLKFGPITYIHQFLYATNTITPEVELKLKEYIQAGFQTEQTYEHKTGGYSTFGESNGAIPSLWLSSYVGATLATIQATADKYNIDYGIGLIDPIARTAKFMISCQNENGSFTENGIIYHKDMQSGTGEGVALVAYTLIGLEKSRQVLKNNPEIVEPITTSIKKGASYIIGQINDITDPYSLIISTYVMHLLNDPSKDGLFNRMEALSITENGRKFWGSRKGESRDVEMTAYALLIYCLRGISQTRGLQIIMWLSDQRGTKGGFVATQDTNVGIQSLSCAGAALFGSASNPKTLAVSYIDWAGKQRSHEVKIDSTNENILQRITIDYKNNEPKNVTLKVKSDNGQTGPSTALADVSLTYNVLGKNLPEYFKISHILNTTDDVVTLQITVSTANGEDTGMCTLIMEIMAGFMIDADEISKDARISRLDNDGEKLILYLNTGVLDGDDETFTINQYRSGGGVVTEAKDRFYECSEYYFKDRKSRKPYILTSPEHCVAVPEDGICRYVVNENARK